MRAARDLLSGLHEELRSNSAATKQSRGMQITDCKHRDWDLVRIESIRSSSKLFRLRSCFGWFQFAVYAYRTGGELAGAVELVERAESAAVRELQEIETRRGRAGGNSVRESGALCCAGLGARLRLATSVHSGSLAVASFLVLVGVLAALGGVCIDSAVAWLLRLRDDWTGNKSSALGWLIFTAFGTVMAVVAASMGHVVTDRAEGSGIPQLKSILAGTWLRRYLSIDTLIAKSVGLVAALASGLVVGKEGPFVHLAAIAAAQLWALPCFGMVRRTEATKRQVLAAAVAAGVTATLGAPIGGMLFSVETTATFYQVSNLWRALLCSLSCIFVFEAIQALNDDELFHPTEFDAPDLTWQIVAFAILGLVCGIFSSLLVACTSSAQLLRRAFQRRCGVCCSRYLLAASVVFVTGTAAFLFPVLRLRDREVINHLFQDKDGLGSARSALPVTPMFNRTAGAALSDFRHLELARHRFLAPEALPEVWGADGGLVASLTAFIVARLALTPVSISLPIPCGLFTPVFALGAATGRLFGEALRLLLPAALSAAVEPGAYAVVGAAALTAGTTHSLSVAVIVFELTQQIHHMLPILVAVVVSYHTASLFTLSVYDMLMVVSALPFLPRLHSSRTYTLTAEEAASEPPFLSPGSSALEAAALLLATAVPAPAGTVGGRCRDAAGAARARLPWLTHRAGPAAPDTAAQSRAERDLSEVLALLSGRIGLEPLLRLPTVRGGPPAEAGGGAPRCTLDSFWRGRCDDILVLGAPGEARRLVGSVARAELERALLAATGSDAASLVAGAARSLRLRSSQAPRGRQAGRTHTAGRVSDSSGPGEGGGGSDPSDAESQGHGHGATHARHAPDADTWTLAFRPLQQRQADFPTARQFGDDEHDASLTALPFEEDEAGTAAASVVACPAAGDEDSRLLPRPGGGSSLTAAELHRPSRTVPVTVDVAPMSLSASTPLAKAHFLFAACLFTQLVVVDGHSAVGVLHRQDMARPEEAAARRQMGQASDAV